MNRRILLGLAALIAIGVSVGTPATAEARHGWGGSHGGSFGGFFSRGGGSFGGFFSRGGHGSCGSHGGHYAAHNDGCWGERHVEHTGCGCGMDSHMQDSECGCDGGYSEEQGDMRQDMSVPAEMDRPSNVEPVTPSEPNANPPQEPSDNTPSARTRVPFKTRT